MPHSRPGPCGTGRYPKEIVPTPAPLADIPRRFGRYGISEADFRARLSRLPRPDAVLVTSLMTYWYPGVTAAIALVQEHFPGVPVILGGIYASLCPDHARAVSAADLVLPGPWETGLPPHLAELGLGRLPGARRPRRPALSGPGPLGPSVLHSHPDLPGLPPGLRLLRLPPAATRLPARAAPPRWPRSWPIGSNAWASRTSPFMTTPSWFRPPDHLLVLLEELVRQGRTFRFHTPNGLHARLITREVAGLAQAGRTLSPCAWGWRPPPWARAVPTANSGPENWRPPWPICSEAGFAPQAIGVYLLAGLPDQDEAEVAASIRRVQQLGATPVLAYYSPIPGTALWPRA